MAICLRGRGVTALPHTCREQRSESAQARPGHDQLAHDCTEQRLRHTWRPRRPVPRWRGFWCRLPQRHSRPERCRTGLTLNPPACRSPSAGLQAGYPTADPRRHRGLSGTRHPRGTKAEAPAGATRPGPLCRTPGRLTDGGGDVSSVVQALAANQDSHVGHVVRQAPAEATPLRHRSGHVGPDSTARSTASSNPGGDDEGGDGSGSEVVVEVVPWRTAVVAMIVEVKVVVVTWWWQ